VQGAEKSFKDTLGDYLKDVNGLIQEAGVTAEKMVTGEVNDIHEVIIAGQKASIALELVVEIRNKLLESYREFMRMQV
jgi:flagellar hook-basal body complex protein FliE